ncbi:MAG: trypsin-like peptidase domain-containing protein [Flavobacteriales bacterium]|nr:trypsin-like peptidase domain-containing protein [Flavobacteriales bacterium]
MKRIIAILKSYFLLLLLPIVLNSCCAIFSTQKVSITSETQGVQLYLNGKEINEGKHRVGKRRPLIIEAEKEGYLSRTSVEVPRKRDPLFYPDLAATVVLIYPLIMDHAAGGTKMHQRAYIIRALEAFPTLDLGKLYVATNSGLDSLSIKSLEYANYSNYENWVSRRNNLVVDTYDDDEEDESQINVTPFIDEKLDELSLKVELTSLFIPYQNYIQLNCEIETVKIHYLTRYRLSNTEATVRWKILDNFGKELTSISTNAVSDATIQSYWSNNYYDQILQVLHLTLLKALKDERFVETLASMRQLLDKEREEISILEISKPIKTLSTLDETVNAQVTVYRADEKESSHGSGCVISPDGYIVTSYRFVEQDKNFKVQFYERSEHDATVLRTDPLSNLALLKVDTIGLASIRPEQIKNTHIGDEVFAVGTPVNRELSQSLTRGYISGERTENDIQYLQTDTRVSTGNSGSPLITRNGKLVGIVNEKILGMGIEGISFAVPSSSIMDRLKLTYSN